MRTLTIIVIALLSLSLSAQSVDEELGFVYVKAEYLLETNRYEEAIKEFTTIIAKDPAFKDALYKRAEAKFNVGAFKGTYNDLLQQFEVKGITPESVLLFGKAQKNLDMNDQAAATMETAGILYPSGTSARSKSTSSRSDNANEEERDEQDHIEAIKDKIASVLEDLVPDTAKDDNSAPSKAPETSTQERTSDNDNRSTGIELESDSDPIYEEPEVDDSVTEIFIDEDVTLEVKNGLGARKILQQPSILILSETSGNVVIDLCVNANGKVTQAEFNKDESSLSTQSIISLAVRKSKEFWFKSSSQEEMCGTIVFKITGSN